MSEEHVNVGEMTVEEFIESLIAIKIGFKPSEARVHKHIWMCNCQAGLPPSSMNLNYIEIYLY